MRAILLAAGRGRRLGVAEPKCLIDIGGRSLLERHLSNMARAGIEEVTIVTGHAHQSMVDAIARIASPLPVELLFNELFHHGSLVSLQRASDRLARGAIWMDADVIYPAALLARLVSSPHDNCALLDGRSTEQGEEMMLGVSEDRLHRIGRSVGSAWDLVGESVGFFKTGPEAGAVLKRVLCAEVAAQRLDQEHEDALNLALSEVIFGVERVDDFGWTEIDFPEDVTKATALAGNIDASSSRPMARASSPALRQG